MSRAQFQIINLFFSGVETNMSLQMIFDPPLRDLTAFARLATKLLRYEVELDWKFSKLLLNRKGLNFSQARKVMRNCNPPTLKKTLYFVLLQTQQQYQPIF